MSQTVGSIPPGSGARSFCAIFLCALLSVSCSSIGTHHGYSTSKDSSSSNLYSLQNEQLNEDPDETGINNPLQSSHRHDRTASADAETQSDFQYLYNKDIADPYQRVLGVSRGHLGMLAETPSSDPAQDLWLRLRNGFQLNLAHKTPRIDSQLNWYVSNPLHIERTVERGRRYMHYIVEEIERREMPMEFALLPVVESAFQPFAHSHASASGLWQFIPSTGRMYGLHQNWWYDGRRDVIASTNAALSYLQNLSDVFDGDWLLALASYNCGAGAVMRAIRYNKERGLPTDFWSLKLPRETMDYVPKLLALAKLIKHPDYYDLALAPLDNEPYFEVVEVGSQIDLSQAAELADIDMDELFHLNPAFNQWATSPTGPHRLLIPRPNADGFRQALATVPPDKRLKWVRYSVANGDTLNSVAQKFSTTSEVIRQTNKLKNNVVRVGQKLLIPAAHKSGQQLAINNFIKPANPSAGKVAKREARIVYTVKTGDTWWDLARKHQVNVRQLAKWNKLKPNSVLKPGQKLVIHSKASAETTVASLAKQPTTAKSTKKLGYRVRSGDSLYRIANKFNVSVQDITSWNNLGNQHLRPGQTLNLYVDISRPN